MSNLQLDDLQVFPCEFPDCKKELNSAFSLRRHYYLMHSKGKHFCCRYCGKAFSLKQYLIEHELMHTNEMPFVCGFNGCQERFRQRGKLCLHRRSHEGYEPRKYKYTDIEERKEKRETRRKRRPRKKSIKPADFSTPPAMQPVEIAQPDIFCSCPPELSYAVQPPSFVYSQQPMYLTPYFYQPF